MKTKSISLVFLLCCILATEIYLAYQWNEAAILCEKSVSEKLRECQSLQEKMDTTFKKLATQNKEQLLATLQEVKPVMGIFTHVEKLLDIAKPVPITGGLIVKAMPDSILLARFPDEFRYEVANVYVRYFLANFPVWNAAMSGNAINMQGLYSNKAYMGCLETVMIYTNSKGNKKRIKPRNSTIDFATKQTL